jgi:hypothetical protein
VSEWINVAENVPDQTNNVLVYCAERDNKIFTAYYCGGNDWVGVVGDGAASCDEMFGDGYIPTHWMPLPSPPTA